MKLLWALALCTFALAAVATAGAPPQLQLQQGSILQKGLQGLNTLPKASPQPRYRLDDAVVPMSYDIKVVPIVPINGTVPAGFVEWTTPGIATINVKCNRATENIALTINAIDIVTASLKVTNIDNGQALAITGTVNDKANQYFNITVGEALVPGGTYAIDMNFTSYISTSVRGLYRAEYTDLNGNQRWLATTQFETVGFREFAPGFDEPKYKATFALTIGRHKEHNAASNAALLETIETDPVGLLPANDYVWDRFNTTPVMSSYLVALVVSDFGHEAADEAILGKPVGIYGPPHLIEKGGGKYAANASAHLLKAFGNKLGVEYKMEKMDSVGVPRGYFQFGAMENWGLNIYRDNLLLYYPNENPETSRYSILSILSHELAHQWFGNLITCQWWSHIFLNEGFATYMSFTGMQETNPEYDAKRAFLYDTVHSALRFDATSGTHPVINTGLREDVEGMTVFDTISYDKGSSLIRMLEGALGEDVLFKGLAYYLEDKQFEPADQHDLFTNLDKAAAEANALPAGKTLDEIMETWTEQSGFPLIHVSRYNNNRTYISQERFRPNSNVASDLEPYDLWDVPIAIATAAEPYNLRPKLWLDRDVVLQSYDIDTTKWFIVNPGGYGFYRTRYDAPLLKLIIDQLENDHTVIDGQTKSTLISDYFTFAAEGLAQYETALELTNFLETETDHVVWMTVFSAFSRIVTAEFSTAGSPKAFADYMRPKAAAALEAIGYKQPEDEHNIVTLLRPSLLNWACALGDTKCSETAEEYIEQWMLVKDESNPIPLDIQAIMYCSALEKNSAHFEFLVDRYVNASNTPGEYYTTQASRLATALACTTDYEQLLRLVSSIFNSKGENKIPIQTGHAAAILTAVGTNSISNVNSAGIDLALGTVRDNVEELVELANGRVGIVSDILSGIGTYQNSKTDLEMHSKIIDTIKEKNPDIYSQIERSLNAVQAKINSNIAWASTNLDNVNAWLSSNV